MSIKCVNQVCQSSVSIKCVNQCQSSVSSPVKCQELKSVVFSVKSTELCVWGYSPLRAACPSGQPLLQHVLSPRATSIPITPVPHTNYYCVQSSQLISRSNRNNKRYFPSLFPYLSMVAARKIDHWPLHQMAANHKSPPILDVSKNYDDWKKLLKIWQQLTSLDSSKQGPAVVLTLEGEAQQAALEISSEDLSSNNGVNKIIERLDTIYKKDELVQRFDKLESFESYKRPNNLSMRDFLAEFELKYNRIKTRHFQTTK